MLDLKNGHQNNKRSKGDKMMRQEFNENGWKILGDWNRWAAENRWKLLGMRSLFAIGAAFDQDIADFREKYKGFTNLDDCLLYTSPSPRDRTRSRMPSSA